jgi:hypothetical protein
MKKIIITVIGILAGIAGVVTVANAGAPNEVITNWLTLQQRLIRSTKGVPHVAYSRHFAYIGVAAYESVVQSDPAYQSLSGQLAGLAIPVMKTPSNVSWSASANGALATMFRYFYGSAEGNKRLIDSLENHYRVTLSNPRSNIRASMEYGAAIANAVIAWCKMDGSDTVYGVYSVPEGEGLWVTTPPNHGAAALPYWCKNRCVVPAKQSFVVDPSIAYGSDSASAFYKAAKEVYVLSKQLTEEQKNIALFWDDSPNGKFLSVFGHWTSILSQVAKSKNLSLMKTAEAFAALSLSQYDAAIGCWEGKYKYHVMRPITFIQKYIDKDWTPLIETPPHPEYPAAHATLSYAAATALTETVGDDMPFDDATYESVGMKRRKFHSFIAAAKEAGYSRLYGGIHYRASIDAGFVLGEKIATHLLQQIRFRKAPAAKLTRVNQDTSK